MYLKGNEMEMWTQRDLASTSPFLKCLPQSEPLHGALAAPSHHLRLLLLPPSSPEPNTHPDPHTPGLRDVIQRNEHASVTATVLGSVAMKRT